MPPVIWMDAAVVPLYVRALHQRVLEGNADDIKTGISMDVAVLQPTNRERNLFPYLKEASEVWIVYHHK